MSEKVEMNHSNSIMMNVVKDKIIGENLRKIGPKTYLTYTQIFSNFWVKILGFFVYLASSIFFYVRYLLLIFKSNYKTLLVLTRRYILIFLAAVLFLSFVAAISMRIKSPQHISKKTNYIKGWFVVLFLFFALMTNLSYLAILIFKNSSYFGSSTSFWSFYIVLLDILPSTFMTSLALIIDMTMVKDLVSSPENFSEAAKQTKIQMMRFIGSRVLVGIFYFMIAICAIIINLVFDCVISFSYVKLIILVVAIAVILFVWYKVYQKSGIYIDKD